MRQASFVRFDRGLVHGSFGFKLVLDYPDGATKPIFGALDTFRKEHPWVEKILCLGGGSPVLDEVAAIAKERGWMVLAEVDGKSRPKWLEHADYRTVIIDNSGWLGFRFNELIYRPSGGEKLKDPEIPPELKGMLYLDAPEFELKEIFSFMAKSTKTWRLYVRPSSEYSVDLDIG